MQFLHNFPIKRKLMVITMCVSGAALLAVGAAFIVYEEDAGRRQMAQDLRITAAMTAANCTAGLSFDEAGSVEQTLASLRVKPDIVQACVYNRAGQPFARYARDPSRPNSLPPAQAKGSQFAAQRLKLFEPVVLAGETVGTIYLEEDLSQLAARRWRYLLIESIALLGSTALAFFLSAWLRRAISEPLDDLTKSVALVRAEKNYSVRAVKQGNDELGSLIDGFNEMLTQIQDRDLHLERRVQERTEALAKSLSLLNATLESTADGILVIDRQDRVVSFNNRFIEMWGFPRGIIAPGETDDGLLPLAVEMIKDGEKFLARVRALYAQPEAASFDVIELKDGRIFERYSKPQMLAGTCVGRVWSFRDVTALAYERDLLEALLDQSPDSIFFKDLRSRYVRLSRTEVKRLFQLALNRHRSADSPQSSAELPAWLASFEAFHRFVIGKSDLDFYPPEKAAEFLQDEQEIIRTGKSLLTKIEQTTDSAGQPVWHLINKTPWHNKEGEIVGTFGTARNITDLKRAEAEIEKAHQRLLETSRLAGMAEVATSVLHNVGNVLNSVNVSTTIVLELARNSRLNNLNRLAALIHEQSHNLAAFFTTDQRGQQLPGYLTQLAQHLASEQAKMIAEIESTRKNVEHIKDIVIMQQSYAKVSGVVEKVKVTDLVEEALRINSDLLSRGSLSIVRDYPAGAVECHIERQKVLQILINLIRNAQWACEKSGRPSQRLTMQVRFAMGRAQIVAQDNGIGIPAENMTRIFNHGFTTRQNGHGFGLHSSALAAKELGGSLTAYSDGPGTGAKFVLDLPLQPPPSA